MRHPLNHFVDFYFCKRHVNAQGLVETERKGQEKIMCSVKPRGSFLENTPKIPNTASTDPKGQLRQRFELVCRRRPFPFEIEKIVWEGRTLKPLGEPELLHENAKIQTADFLRLHALSTSKGLPHDEPNRNP